MENLAISCSTMNNSSEKMVESNSDRKKKTTKAGNKCCLPHCRKSKRHYPDIKLFRFPRSNTILFEEWVKKCSLEKDTVQRKPILYLCDRHFSSDCIGKKYLDRYAVPTLYLTESAEIETIKQKNRSDNGDNLEFNCIVDIDPLRTTSRNHARLQSPPSISSSNCDKCLKNEEFYRKKYFNMIKKLRVSIKRNRNLKEKYESLRKKLKQFEKKMKVKESFQSETDKGHINPNAKTFCKILMKHDSGTNVRWHDWEKRIVQSIYFRSISTYSFLRNILKFNLPHPACLSSWSDIKNLQPGRNACIYNVLQATVRRMKPPETECVLIFDKVSIRKQLSYNGGADVIDGLVDLGFERTNEMGSQICLFMIRGIVENWEFVFNYFVTATSVKTEILKEILLSNLDIVTKMGLKVRAVTCKQSPNNRKCYDLLGATLEKPYFFIHNTIKIYLLYDVSCIFKSIRNDFIKGDFKTPDGIARFDVVREVFELEHGKETKMTKLTIFHINPTNFQKMRVDLAVQTLSNSVANAIQAMNETSQFKRNSSEIASSTSSFIRKMNTYFDCLNGKNFNDSNPINTILVLQEIITYIQQIEYVGNRIFSTINLIQTTRGILSLADEMFQETSNLQILTSCFNHDPLENIFPFVSAHCRNYKNPSAHEFNITMAKLLSLKRNQFGNATNCKEENGIFVPMDFQNILKDNDSVPLENPSAVVDIYQENEEYFNSANVPLQFTSSRYFIGYIAQQISCIKCQMDILNPSEILKYPPRMYAHHTNAYQNEPDFGSLCAPSDLLFEVCKIHRKVFEKLFSENRARKNIKQVVMEQCVHYTNNTIYSFWFNEKNTCYEHRMEILNLLVLGLIRKHCSWETYNDKQKYVPSEL